MKPPAALKTFKLEVTTKKGVELQELFVQYKAKTLFGKLARNDPTSFQNRAAISLIVAGVAGAVTTVAHRYMNVDAVQDLKVHVRATKVMMCTISDRLSIKNDVKLSKVQS
ncbi:hypothetical protein F443_02598 [Phytophthora nicotianae P1569]|uniref:Uncharacterized protein n=1 Tax=Phytophthora nicotianae P1569 TaxID=1317065 RepID=V9FSZ2_PHYNI|nr:hypothetical protein F443_02598 [Phytophthora nicotianae P1569]